MGEVYRLIQENVGFFDCTFEDISFDFIIIENVSFDNCLFKNCIFRMIRYSVFKSCTALNCKIDESISNCILSGNKIELYNDRYERILFHSCKINYCAFYISAKREKGYAFGKCVIDRTRIKGDVRFIGQNNITESYYNDEKIRQCYITSDYMLGYKKVVAYQSRRFAILKLRIDPGQIVICPNGDKCRTPRVFVLDVIGEYNENVFRSLYSSSFKYKIGEYVHSDDFDMSMEECKSGIHFFKTKEEAEAYV